MCDLSDLTKDDFYLAGLTADNCPPYPRRGTQAVHWLPEGVAVQDTCRLVATRIEFAFFCILRPKTQQWPQDWKRSVFIPIPKKGNAKECSDYRTISHISHTSKVMLKLLQARLQQYVNHELPDVQAGFRKGRGTTDQIANICWTIKKAREFQKNIYFCFIDYAKAFDCVDHNKLWKILKEMGIPDHLTFLF